MHKLNLDQLAVDSFDTSDAPEEKGTVFAEQCTCHTNCTCPGCPTCDIYECANPTEPNYHTCNLSNSPLACCPD